MTTLKEIMSPKSIAIVGASDNKARIGGRPLAHMIEQKFSGGIFPINPNRDTVQGIKRLIKALLRCKRRSWILS
jgi:acyl-CoA synthetase (NDP forming)